MKRIEYVHRIQREFRVHPVVGLLGPRQSGKTTLAHQFLEHTGRRVVHYFDLEDPADLARLDQPMLALGTLRGIVIIDEIQRRPELFPILRVLVDRKAPVKYLILGSASRELIRQSSETLAGRIGYLELPPFSLSEVSDLAKLWLRGGFPRSFLARSHKESFRWRAAYISTFLERDIPGLGLNIAPGALRRFWMMLSHYHGNFFNASEVGRSLGVNHKTVRHYLDVLVGTFMIRELSPWFENIGKRQVKSPKIYYRDSGILHALLGIPDRRSLLNHPKLGASWEGMALEEICRHHEVERGECYFWSLHGQAELDLLIIKEGRRLGFEFKYSDAPRFTRSMQTAADCLGVQSLTVITPGSKRFPLAKNGKRSRGVDAVIEGFASAA